MSETPDKQQLLEEIRVLVEKKRNMEYTTKAEKKLLTDDLDAKRAMLQDIIVSNG